MTNVCEILTADARYWMR